MKCHSLAPCSSLPAWLSLYIIPCVLCVYALSFCVVFVMPVCFPTITMTHLYSLITLMYINTCRHTLNALRQICTRACTHTNTRPREAHGMPGRLTRVRSLQLAHTRAVDKQRAELGARCSACRGWGKRQGAVVGFLLSAFVS